MDLGGLTLSGQQQRKIVADDVLQVNIKKKRYRGVIYNRKDTVTFKTQTNS